MKEINTLDELKEELASLTSRFEKLHNLILLNPDLKDKLGWYSYDFIERQYWAMLNYKGVLESRILNYETSSRDGIYINEHE